MLTHISESLVDVAGGILPALVILAFGVDKVDDTSAQELLRQVITHRVLAHEGVAVAHALEDQGHHDGHRHGGFLMLCFFAIIGFAIVIHIVAQVCHGVVWAVAAYRTRKMQFIGQAVLLDKAVGGQCHRAALRIAHAYALPAVLELAEREHSFVIFI